MNVSNNLPYIWGILTSKDDTFSVAMTKNTAVYKLKKSRMTGDPVAF